MGVKKPKKFWLNMNNYRNWHYQVSNNLKKLFKESIKIPNIVISGPVRIAYTFYFPNKIKRDIGNFLAVVDKFTADALVEGGHIEEDNYSIVCDIKGKFGAIDKSNPRCEVRVEGVR